jgi:hypothetical protein
MWSLPLLIQLRGVVTIGVIGGGGVVQPEEFAKIACMLNFDMVGSPNFIRGVYNGSSADPALGAQVERGSRSIQVWLGWRQQQLRVR